PDAFYNLPAPSANTARLRQVGAGVWRGPVVRAVRAIPASAPDCTPGPACADLLPCPATEDEHDGQDGGGQAGATGGRRDDQRGHRTGRGGALRHQDEAGDRGRPPGHPALEGGRGPAASRTRGNGPTGGGGGRVTSGRPVACNRATTSCPPAVRS